MCGVYPISKSNGVFFVVAEGQEFLTYWARGAMYASCLVGYHRIFGDTAPMIDWFFH